MNHSLPSLRSFPLLHDEVVEVSDTWRSILIGAAMGALVLLTNTIARRTLTSSREVVRLAGHEAPGNWHR